MVKNLPVNARDTRDSGWTLGSGRSPGEENGYPLQNSCLKNSMDRGPGGLKSMGSQRVANELAAKQQQQHRGKESRKEYTYT